MDLDGLVTGWNAGAETIFGWSEAAMHVEPARAFFTEEDVAAGIPELEMKGAREEGHFEVSAHNAKRLLQWHGRAVWPVCGECIEYVSN